MTDADEARVRRDIAKGVMRYDDLPKYGHLLIEHRLDTAARAAEKRIAERIKRADLFARLEAMLWRTRTRVREAWDTIRKGRSR